MTTKKQTPNGPHVPRIWVIWYEYVRVGIAIADTLTYIYTKTLGLGGVSGSGYITEANKHFAAAQAAAVEAGETRTTPTQQSDTHTHQFVDCMRAYAVGSLTTTTMRMPPTKATNRVHRIRIQRIASTHRPSVAFCKTESNKNVRKHEHARIIHSSFHCQRATERIVGQWSRRWFP